MVTKSRSVLPYDPSTVRDQPRKRGKLPCGSRVCVRCHRGCGVVMAAYLSGLDEPVAKTGDERDLPEEQES